MASESGFGADLDLDYSHLDELSPAEREILFRWYGETHGADASDLSSVPYVPFLADNRPGALKRWRRFLKAMGSSESRLPPSLVPLLFLHLYMSMGNEEGVRYEITIARESGATRVEVLDAISFGFLNSGPYGVSVVARAASDLLSDWAKEDDRWSSSSPINAAAQAVQTAAKLTSGAVRDGAPVETWLNPLAVEALCDRVDSVFQALPPLTAALFLIHLGAARANATICEHASRRALQLAVPHAWFEAAALWGASFSGSVGLELAARAVSRLSER